MEKVRTGECYYRDEQGYADEMEEAVISLTSIEKKEL